MATMLTGAQAKTLHEACTTSKKIASLEEKLSICKELLDLDAGSYVNSKGDVVSICDTKKYSDVNSEKVLTWMKSKRLGSKFIECVKIQITPLRKFMEDVDINRFRKLLKTSKRYTFK